VTNENTVTVFVKTHYHIMSTKEKINIFGRKTSLSQGLKPMISMTWIGETPSQRIFKDQHQRDPGS
jgi:hypothetical protein